MGRSLHRQITLGRVSNENKSIEHVLSDSGGSLNRRTFAIWTFALSNFHRPTYDLNDGVVNDDDDEDGDGDGDDEDGDGDGDDEDGDSDDDFIIMITLTKTTLAVATATITITSKSA